MNAENATQAPAKPSKRLQRYVVCRVAEFPATGRLIVEINGRSIGIFNIRGEFFAMLNRCPHLGGPLCVGQVLNEIQSTGPGNMTLNTGQDLLACPWHNWEFDIRTGQSYWDPKNLHARPFGVEVEAGESVSEQVSAGSVGRIAGPYKAETIEVGVEAEYVVLSLKAQPRASGAGVAAAGAASGEGTPDHPGTAEQQAHACAIPAVVPTSARTQTTINDRAPLTRAPQTEK
ncbi:Rieske (2Fe-2S) protein [Subtercola sp. RTI3]|uniref:Rieske (2Fe-2S) protein n=1 Tax=Subtercola sp. RTI3 TaxID=3048639 RepID=UPI002B2359B4|nr:Rieske (2Fe-2S) protein [Subtercola sp. RTI3]MEA9984185.1 Rieske (2Fe-2S) protein [Subtercola sp. RTI3]